MRQRSLLFIVSKIFFLQLFFYFTLKYAPQGHGILFFCLGLSFMLMNYFLIKDLILFSHYLILVAVFLVCGFLQDTIFISLGLLQFKDGSIFPPIWIPTLWMMYLGYYGDVFRKMLKFPIWLMSLLGALGGTLAYYRGMRDLDVVLSSVFYFSIALSWMIFKPFSLKLFLFYIRRKNSIHQ